MPKTTATKSEKELAKAVKDLSSEIRKLKGMELLKVFTHPWKFAGYSFLKGVMMGFGSVLGASVLVALFAYILSQVSLIPVIGDFVEDIMNEIQLNGPFNKMDTSE